MNNILLLTLFASLSILNQTNGHTVEIRHCLTTEGKLRVFLEHWHNDFIETPAEAGTVEVAIEELNSGYSVQNILPTGIVNNIDVNNGENLPGCVGNGTPKLTSICTDQIALNDWAYFDFTFSCEIPSSHTFVKGNTDILQRGCTEVMPVTIIPSLDYCPGSPSASPSVSFAPSIKKDLTNCFDINNPDAFPEESCNLLTTRSSCEKAKCVWINSDQYCGVCADVTTKNSCNNQRYCEWFKYQPSASPTVQPSVTPSASPTKSSPPSAFPSEEPSSSPTPKGVCMPFDPETAMSTAECRSYTEKFACKNDTNQCVWFNSDGFCGTCDELPGKNFCIKRGCNWVKF